MIYSIFNKTTGSLARTVNCDSSLIGINTQENEIAIEGVFSNHYLDAENQLQPIPEAPSQYHVWDSLTRSWLVDMSATHHIIWKLIQKERDRRKYAGVQINTHWFHSDDASRIQQMALSMMGNGMPAGIQWKTMAGDFVEMTPALASQIFAAVAANDQAIFSVAEQHKQAMQTSSEPWLYDYSIGWPQTFEEYTAMLN